MNPHQSDDSIWIGKAAMARLVERFNVYCQHYLEMKDPDKGANQLADFLQELMAISNIRFRLVRSGPDGENEELDLSTLFLAPVEGKCEFDKIEAWIKSGAAVVANASDLIVHSPEALKLVPYL